MPSKKESITVTIPVEIVMAIDEISIEQEVSRMYVVREILLDWYNKNIALKTKGAENTTLVKQWIRNFKKRGKQK